MTASDIFLLALPCVLAGCWGVTMCWWIEQSNRADRREWKIWDLEAIIAQERDRTNIAKALANKFRERLKKYGHLEDGE